MRRHYACLLAASLILNLNGCGGTANLPVQSGYVPDPALPEPNKSLIPTVNIAIETGWPAGANPQAALGFRVKAFARNLDSPRWLQVLPNGGRAGGLQRCPAQARKQRYSRLDHEESHGTRRLGRRERRPHQPAERQGR